MKSHILFSSTLGRIKMISQEALEQFKRIWKDEHQEEISDERAMEEAVNLLTMFNAIYRPIKKEWVQKICEISDKGAD